jgi:hypothetical protein
LNLDPFASFLVPEISLGLGVESLKLRKTTEMLATQC